MSLKSTKSTQTGEKQTGKTKVTQKSENASSWLGVVTSKGKSTTVKVNSISNLLARCAAME